MLQTLRVCPPNLLLSADDARSLAGCVSSNPSYPLSPGRGVPCPHSVASLTLACTPKILSKTSCNRASPSRPSSDARFAYPIQQRHIAMDRKPKTTFQLDSSFTTAAWCVTAPHPFIDLQVLMHCRPQVSLQDQETILELLCR